MNRLEDARTTVLKTILGLGLAATVGCAPAQDGAVAGQETAACVDSGCLGTLVCLSELCVEPDAGVETQGSDGGPGGSSGTGGATSTETANGTGQEEPMGTTQAVDTGQVDTGQIDTGQVDTGQNDTGQIDTGPPGESDTASDVPNPYVGAYVGTYALSCMQLSQDGTLVFMVDEQGELFGGITPSFPTFFGGPRAFNGIVAQEGEVAANTSTNTELCSAQGEINAAGNAEGTINCRLCSGPWSATLTQ